MAVIVAVFASMIIISDNLSLYAWGATIAPHGTESVNVPRPELPLSAAMFCSSPSGGRISSLRYSDAENEHDAKEHQASAKLEAHRSPGRLVPRSMGGRGGGWQESYSPQTTATPTQTAGRQALFFFLAVVPLPARAASCAGPVALVGGVLAFLRSFLLLTKLAQYLARSTQ